MKLRNISVATAVAASLVLSSCGKYEEGPNFSLASKKGRVVGEWKLVEEKENGQAVTLSEDEKDDTYEFTKDNEYIVTDPGNDTQKGKWDFGDKKETLVISSDFGGVAISVPMEILRLTKKEMWVKYTFGSDSYEEHYEAK